MYCLKCGTLLCVVSANNVSSFIFHQQDKQITNLITGEILKPTNKVLKFTSEFKTTGTGGSCSC